MYLCTYLEGVCSIIISIINISSSRDASRAFFSDRTCFWYLSVLILKLVTIFKQYISIKQSEIFDLVLFMFL